jgi:hypothetical protein
MLNRRLNPAVILWVWACQSTDAQRWLMYAKLASNIHRIAFPGIHRGVNGAEFPARQVAEVAG